MGSIGHDRAEHVGSPDSGQDVFSPARRRSASTKAHVVCSVIYIYI